MEVKEKDECQILASPQPTLFLFKKRGICCVGIYFRMLAAPIIPLSFSYHTIS